MDAIKLYLDGLQQRGWHYSQSAPASDDDFAALEALLGQALPPSFCALYRRMNGQNPQHLPAAEPRWLSLDEIPHKQRQWQDFLVQHYGQDWQNLRLHPDYYVQNQLFLPQWLPFMEDKDGSLYCLDFAPAADGRAGQIIFVALEDELSAYDVVYEAPDLESWLRDLSQNYAEADVPSVALLCTDYFHHLWQLQTPLNPPVRSASWAWLAEQFSPLPIAMQQLYALFDGMRESCFHPALRWLPVAEMKRFQQDWQQNLKPENAAQWDETGRVQNCMFHPLWLPFLQWGSACYCLDFAPAPRGRVGQIIRVERENEYYALFWESDDFEDFLENLWEESRAEEAL